MQMVGLEQAKQLFLQIRAAVQIANKQKRILSSSDLSIVIVGNCGIGWLSSYLPLPFSLTRTGRSRVKELYANFLQEMGMTGKAWIENEQGPDSADGPMSMLQWIIGRTSEPPAASSKIRLALPDYSNEELQRLLIEGGPHGKYLGMMIRAVGSARGPGFRNLYALKEAWGAALERQAARLYQAQRQGQRPDCLLLTGEDLVGPDPATVYRESPAWAKLQAMVGLEAVKSAVELLFQQATRNYHRLHSGQMLLQPTLNRVFLGPPGTGKTTVATLYGQILADLKLLSSGKVIVKNPSDFIAPYLGQSEHRTRRILKEAKGNVLIIDDAYMLYPGRRSGSRDESDDYRIAVIDTLVAELDNNPGNDRCVILLGYEEQMEDMFRKSNPGLARRFALADAFRFTNYTVRQLGQILDLKLKEQDLQATDEAREVAMQVLETASARPNFGNGGEVENLLSHAKAAYEKRTAAVPWSEPPGDITFAPEDFDLHYQRHLQAAAACAARFQDLVGVDEITRQFQEYQTTVAAMRQSGLDPRPFIPFTFVFRGPPGTGKTSVARRLGQIFYDMGFLSAPGMIECSVSDLVAPYQGQTGHRVVDLLDRALGQVLFIDEAYRLAGGDYERQAVDELVDGLTKTRYAQKLVVVLAGYSQEMVRLMQVNRGLRSRFPTEVVFYPLSADDCWRLLQRELTSAGILIIEERGSTTAVTRALRRLGRMESWANARDVKRLAGVLVRQAFGGTADNSTRQQLESR
ncbi:P-loop containing nucleoside triphosphate hydrolase protein [Aspergillus nidulans var. acristatus]